MPHEGAKPPPQRLPNGRFPARPAKTPAPARVRGEMADGWLESLKRRAVNWRKGPNRFTAIDSQTGADSELGALLLDYRARGISADDASEDLGISKQVVEHVTKRALEALAQADYRNAAIVRADANSKLDAIEAQLQAIAMDSEQSPEVRVKALTGMRQVIADRIDLYGAKAKPVDSDLEQLAVEVLTIASEARTREQTLTIDAQGMVTPALEGRK